MRYSTVAAFLLATLVARPSFADVTGPATVVDGDTFVVAGEHVRLQGIDAPELHQSCTAYGQEWACGRTSAEWLRNRLNGRKVESATLATGTAGCWQSATSAART